MKKSNQAIAKQGSFFVVARKAEIVALYRVEREFFPLTELEHFLEANPSQKMRCCFYDEKFTDWLKKNGFIAAVHVSELNVGDHATAADAKWYN